jgi:hypothetical protein
LGLPDDPSRDRGGRRPSTSCIAGELQFFGKHMALTNPKAFAAYLARLRNKLGRLCQASIRGTALMIGFTSRKALVPGRLQAIAEISYEFIAANLQRSTGSEGMKFFPLVFSLFMFILVLNVISLIPHTFAVTAQIIITASLAMLVFLTVIVYGLMGFAS